MDHVEHKAKLLERIAELEQKVHDLETDLVHDKLTSLKTRSYFEEKSKGFLNHAEKIKRGKRRDWIGFKDICFLFFDIDYFKKINDTYGHDVGDMVLKKVAETIKKSLRAGDIVARWGGEEFIAILLGSHEKESKVKAEEIRKNVQEVTFDDIEDLKISVSIGVAEFKKSISFENLVKNADRALYKAKETGRNKVVAFSELAE